MADRSSRRNGRLAASGGGTDSGALPPGLAALPWLAVSVRLANTAVPATWPLLPCPAHPAATGLNGEDKSEAEETVRSDVEIVDYG